MKTSKLLIELKAADEILKKLNLGSRLDKRKYILAFQQKDDVRILRELIYADRILRDWVYKRRGLELGFSLRMSQRKSVILSNIDLLPPWDSLRLYGHKSNRHTRRMAERKGGTWWRNSAWSQTESPITTIAARSA